MDPSFIPVDVTPSKTPFALDQLRRSYKTALSAEDAIAAAPAVGTADEVFPCMFLMPISAPESAASATHIDLLYMGCIAFTGTGEDGDPFLPVLPDQKHDSSNAVMSASSSKNKAGVVLTSPATIQYYAPINQLSYFSYLAPGTLEADDPTDAPILITYSVGDTSFNPSGGIGDLVSQFFSPLRTATRTATEIVPGKFWQNTSQKTNTLSPWLFDLPSGPHVVLASESFGYAAGDVVTITVGGESATVQIDAPIQDFGYILNYTQLTNTFTANHTLVAGSAPTHGPPRSTALWNIFIIP
jgi:hypothetical protein